MASGVHSDKRSRVGDSPRFQWESVSRCCAELYVPRPKTRLRSGLARKHLSVSRQTSRAPVSAPIDGVLSYVHSGCPKLNRSLRGETRAVRSSGEIPGSPRRSCGGPPVPPRGGLQYRLTTWFFLPRNLGPCSGTRFDQLGNATRRGASGGG